MGFDIFCAVCGGPACAFITICDKSRRAALREKREEDPDFSEKGARFADDVICNAEV